ncbi:MAG: rod shape-determining protein RodA [Salinivirgaceae bacterium]|nr:rod shape-determining protein RodA [Salinivirgaceae bacterium]
MERRSSFLKNVDWLTVAIYFVLVFLGWINIYSASYNSESSLGFSFDARYVRQLVWIGTAIGLATLALILDSKFYSAFAEMFYIISIVLLMVTLVIGGEVNGAKSWIELGPVKIQPAEFAKISTALVLSKVMSRYDFQPESFKSLFTVTAVIILSPLFILLQNDTGSALVFFALYLAFFREGMPIIYVGLAVWFVLLFILSLLLETHTVIIIISLLGFVLFHIYYNRLKETLIGVGIVCVISGAALLVLIQIMGFDETPLWLPFTIGIGIPIPYFLIHAYKHKLNHTYRIILLTIASIALAFSVDYAFNNILAPHQRTRINHVLGIEFDPQGAGYNVNQSKIAIGSGGFSGKGFLQGTQTKFKFVPEQSTDFIFCTIGEEWGFVGTTIVLLLFLWLLLKIVAIAERQKSKFSRIYAYCVAAIFFFHVAINVGMTIGIAPVIGIPLPFFSYGGSSLWGFTFLLFILIKLDANRDELIM